MDYGLILASGFITTIVFIGIMYYLLSKATPES